MSKVKSLASLSSHPGGIVQNYVLLPCRGVRPSTSSTSTKRKNEHEDRLTLSLAAHVKLILTCRKYMGNDDG
jgi:hypothetical protein